MDFVSQIAESGVWFVDIPRTSSSSIRTELSQAYGAVFGKSDLLDSKFISEQTVSPHLPSQHIKKYIGESNWAKLFTFTIVRNPWDRMVSLFNYRKRIGQISERMKFTNYVIELDNTKSWGMRGSLFSYHGHYLGCSDYINDEKGNVMVDFVGKYEDRESSLEIVSERLQLSELGKLRIQMANTGEHYSQFYDNETKEIIEKLYKEDIELFSYKFENG